MSREVSDPAEVVVPILEESLTITTEATTATPSTTIDKDDAVINVSKPKVLFELDIPPSVTNPLGCKVHLLGTAHTSHESADEARKLILDIKPDLVFVELCKARESLLSPEQIQRVPTMEEMFKRYKEGKQPLWGIVYGWLLAKVADEIGVLPGRALKRYG